MELVLERAHVGAVLAGEDDEVVGDLELLADLEDLDVLGLLLVRDVGRRGG